MPGLEPVLLAVYSEVEGRELVEVTSSYWRILSVWPWQNSILKIPIKRHFVLTGLAKGRSQPQSPWVPWLALQRAFGAPGGPFQLQLWWWQDETDNGGRRRSAVWYVDDLATLPRMFVDDCTQTQVLSSSKCPIPQAKEVSTTSTPLQSPASTSSSPSSYLATLPRVTRKLFRSNLFHKKN